MKQGRPKNEATNNSLSLGGLPLHFIYFFLPALLPFVTRRYGGMLIAII